MIVTATINVSYLVVTALASTVVAPITFTSDRDVIEQRAEYALRCIMEGVIASVVQSTALAYVAGNHDLRDWGEAGIGVRVDVSPR